jgi:hypothetical protein
VHFFNNCRLFLLPSKFRFARSPRLTQYASLPCFL